MWLQPPGGRATLGAQIDINPLLALPGDGGLLALRCARHFTWCRHDHPTTSKPAVRPYPVQYVSPWTDRDGRTLLIRPIRPEDEPLLVKFHESLSERSVSFRYFHAMKLSARVSHER